MGIAIPTFKVLLDERKEKADGSYPLKLRVTFNRKRMYYGVGMDLTKEQYKKLETTKQDKLKEVRLKARAIEVKAERIYKELREFSFAEFETHFLAKTVEVKPVDVYSLFSVYIEKLKAENRISTAQSYECTLNSIKKFKSRLTFDEITPEFLNSYEKYMLDDGKSSTTVGIYLRSLRTIYNQGIEAGLAKKELYPFKKAKFQIPAGRNVKKALVIKEIQQIFEYETPPGTSMEKAKDFWIFSYLCNGLNLKDICRLRYKDIDGDTLHVVRAKTQLSTKSNQKTISIHLTDQAKAIIEKWGQQPASPSIYVFPILSEGLTALRERQLIQHFTKLVNKYMGRIGESLGISKHITSYTARHSFSTVLKRSGAPIEYISESLGHSSYKTTQSYLDSFEDDVRKQYSELLLKF
ncbi:site-specific integrase [Dyadobacter sp. MSC1_007]|jgi:integrase/recombinase XerD|uniref:site-specific integrase n=1 Tax=Dyadobacter sp. MSC1_007 TaxID=2909264 RepID=UPI00202EB589|nr:site-specific integrase [Dyadobacter sp. MSC1_007]